MEAGDPPPATPPEPAPAPATPLPGTAEGATAPARPGVWPCLAVLVGVIPLNLAVSSLFLVALLFATGRGDIFQPSGGGASSGGSASTTEAGAEDDAPDAMTEALLELAETPLGMLAILLPSQLVLVGLAMLLGGLSRLPWRRRLGLVRGWSPRGEVALLVLATPLFQVLSWLLALLVVDPDNQQLQLLQGMFTGATGIGAVLILLLVGPGAGFAEELVFRGYIQRGLLRAWPAWLAIGVSGVGFSALHIDPQHAVTVFPIGVWCGVVAWRTGAVWPAMLAHAYNNLLIVGPLVFLGEERGTLVIIAALPVALACFALWTAVLRRRSEAEDSVPPPREVG